MSCAFAGTAWIPSFVRNVYSANFAEDRDISDPKILAGCLAGLVEDPAAIISAANSDETKTRLRQNTERAKALGIFGSPSFVVDGELFWGNDRLEAAFDWSAGTARSR